MTIHQQPRNLPQGYGGVNPRVDRFFGSEGGATGAPARA